MPCQPIDLGNGVTGIACSRTRRRKCSGCGRPAALLCDWKVKDNKSGTCDRPICAGCSTSPAPDKDLCPDHARAWRVWLEAQTEKSDGHHP